MQQVYLSKRWMPHLSNISPKAKIGKDCVIHAGTHIHDEVEIGNRVKIQAQVFIPNGVFIESDVFIGPQVCFTNDKELGKEFKISKTFVRRGAKIGANSTIIAGVTIGKDAVIGAGSVVTKNVPAGEVWCGNPARCLHKK
jgi:UDP-2-acetamido-3-amino-2,3-dideoxy-glucuronate N-acetyltransferase